MKEFILSHPNAGSEKVFPEGGTVFHYLINNEKLKHVEKLLELSSTTEDQMVILDNNGFTPLGVGAKRSCRDMLKILKLVVKKNSTSPNTGEPSTLPVTAAAKLGFKEEAVYLFGVTDETTFKKENDLYGFTLLLHCIEKKLFAIALRLIEICPNILHKKDGFGINAISALAKIKISALPSESGHYKSKSDEAGAFLRVVCAKVSEFDTNTMMKDVYGAMVEAAARGNIGFITEMLSFSPSLIWAHKNNEGIFIHAVKNRREKVFNLVYGDMHQKDSLLGGGNKVEKNNILHCAANSVPSHMLDRTLGPILQVQRELKWFEEVQNLAHPRYRDLLNKDNLTPGELFTKSHKEMIDAGEKSMKDIAQSSTVVGALIVTIMFAAAFTVPGGNGTDGYPVFSGKDLFKVYIVADAFSLLTSTASVLLFLEILTSSYAESDFLTWLPAKLFCGLSTLLLSIVAMMVAFCAALAIMLKGRLEFIIPIVLYAIVVLLGILCSILPFLFKIVSTFWSIFDRNTKLPSKKVIQDTTAGDLNEGKNMMNNLRSKCFKKSTSMNAPALEV